MKYRVLGETGIHASVIAMGTHQFSGEWGVTYSADDVSKIVHRAGELGINVIDTAECYGDHAVEALIGEAVHSMRDKWIIATKFGHTWRGPLKVGAWAPDEVQKQLEDSLRALKTDYVDIYQFHSGANEFFYNDALWEMLEKQVALGKIRHLGISHSGELTSKGDLGQLEKASQYDAKVMQIVYNRLSREAEEKILPFCKEHHLGVFARVPLSRGFLSGKYRPDAVFAHDDVRASAPPGFNEKRLREVEEIKRTEVPSGMDMAEWALGWCLAHPAVTSVIVGSKNIAQLEANAAAASVEIKRNI